MFLFCVPSLRRRRYAQWAADDWITLSAAGPCAGPYGTEVSLYSSRPFVAEWFTPDGQPVFDTDVDGHTARGLQAGRHTVSVRFGSRHEEVAVDIRATAWPTVLGYVMEGASAELSRDGAVTALTNLEEGDEAVVLWTSGHRTVGPVLRGVRPGQYAAIVTHVNGKPVPCVHACEPAVLSVRESVI